MVIEVKALACQLPAELELPLSKLHVPDIRRAVLERGLVAAIGETTIWRWLHEDAIKPWQHRSWLFPRDPDFEVKAAVVLDLYQRRFENRRLRPDEYVISADEKTSVQARCRCHPSLPPSKARAMRVEHALDSHDLFDEPPEGIDACVRLASPEDRRAVAVPGGEVLQSARAVVLGSRSRFLYSKGRNAPSLRAAVRQMPALNAWS